MTKLTPKRPLCRPASLDLCRRHTLVAPNSDTTKASSSRRQLSSPSYFTLVSVPEQYRILRPSRNAPCQYLAGGAGSPRLLPAREAEICPSASCYKSLRRIAGLVSGCGDNFGTSTNI